MAKLSPSIEKIMSNLSLWWEYVDPNRLTSEEEFEAMSEEEKMTSLRDCGFLDEASDAE